MEDAEDPSSLLPGFLANRVDMWRPTEVVAYSDTEIPELVGRV